MKRWIVLCLMGTGCFQVTSRPTCTDVKVTEVGDDEETPMGTADALLDLVMRDATVPGTWDDGTPVDVELLVARGDGPATWVEVEQTSHKTRSWGFGRYDLMIAVTCEDELRVPIEADVQTADARLVVPVSGQVTRSASDPDMWPDREAQLYLDGGFAAATFPDTEHDPAAFDDKYSFANLFYGEDGRLVEGTAGWGGSQRTPEVNSAIAEYVVNFAEPEPEP